MSALLQKGKLPRGWTRIRMGEVGRWFGGGTPSKANPRFWTGGNIPWVSPKDMKSALITDAQDHITEDAVAQSATNLVEAGSILIVVRSGILQHTLPVAVVQRQVALNQDLKAVKPRENIRSDYLALALKAFERDILHTCTKTGTTVQSLELPVFLRFEIPVAPLPEQRRIVAEIEKQFTRLEAGVAALRRVQANLKRYRAAVLKAACEGRLVPTEAELNKSGSGVPPLGLGKKRQDAASTFETGEALLARILTERRQNWQGRGQYKEPAAPDTADLPSLPEGWAWSTADQFTSVITDGEHITPERSDSGILLLSARNVLDGRIALEDVDYVPQREYDRIAKRLVVVPGDVLLSCSGSVGRSAVVPEGLLFTLVRSVAVLKPLAAMGKYLSIALRSPLLKRQITSKQTQTAQANIFQGKIKVLCVPLPPITEQTRIVAEVERRLSVVEELEMVVSANLQRATRLRQAILQKAFTGKL